MSTNQTVKARFAQKYGTTEEWQIANNNSKFTPLKGEVITYADEGKTPRVKIGNGTTTVTNLPFITPSQGVTGYRGWTINRMSVPGTQYQFLYLTDLDKYENRDDLIGKSFTARIEWYKGTQTQVIDYVRYGTITGISENQSNPEYGWRVHVDVMPAPPNTTWSFNSTNTDTNILYLPDYPNLGPLPLMIIDSAVAFGKETLASGEAAFAEGIGTIASGDSQHVQGKYNEINSNYAHIVGNGESNAERSNAHTLDWNGNAWFAGDVTVGDNKKLATEEAVNAINTIVANHTAAISQTNTTISTIQTTITNHAEDIEEIKSLNIGNGTGDDSLVQKTPLIETDTINQPISASGKNAVALGYATQASGTNSHTEGNATIASHNNTHAEGWKTQATYAQAHAEGTSTIALSDSAHAEGDRTKAGCKGFKITSVNHTSHQYTLEVPDDISQGDAEAMCIKLQGKNYSYRLRFSKYNVGQIMQATLENKTITVTLDENTYTEEAMRTTDDNNYLTIVGDPEIGFIDVGYGAHSEGYGTLAKERVAHAEGYGTEAVGMYSHTEGLYTTAWYGSHAEGTNTLAMGECSHTEGHFTHTEGNYAHAEGAALNTEESRAKHGAFGYASHSEGFCTVANGAHAHAEGELTTAFGKDSHAQGCGTILVTDVLPDLNDKTPKDTIKNAWKADSKFNLAFGAHSHTEGKNTIALSESSHAEGTDSKATGGNGHAEGGGTLAQGADSHAEGNGSHALGGQSHAEGLNTRAKISGTHAEGLGTHTSEYKANATATIWAPDGSDYGQHVEGRYNKVVENMAHIVGNGKTSNQRSNAHTLDWSGNAWFAGNVQADKKLIAGTDLEVTGTTNTPTLTVSDTANIKTLNVTDTTNTNALTVDSTASIEKLQVRTIEGKQLSSIQMHSGLINNLNTNTLTVKDKPVATQEWVTENGVAGLTNGAGKNSIIQKTSSAQKNNYAYGEGSIALGESSIAGALGYYYNAMWHDNGYIGIQLTRTKFLSSPLYTNAPASEFNLTGKWQIDIKKLTDYINSSEFEEQNYGAEFIVDNRKYITLTLHASLWDDAIYLRSNENEFLKFVKENAESPTFELDGEAPDLIMDFGFGISYIGNGVNESFYNWFTSIAKQVTIEDIDADIADRLIGKPISLCINNQMFNNLQATRRRGAVLYIEGDLSAWDKTTNETSNPILITDDLSIGEAVVQDGGYALGLGVISPNKYCCAIGKYNAVDISDNYALMIGGGTGPAARKNIATLDQKGNAVFAGDICYTDADTIVSLKEEISNLKAQITALYTLIEAYHPSI